MTDKLPDFVKGIINSALANVCTSIGVACVDEYGQPVLTLRGSTQVPTSETQLSEFQSVTPKVVSSTPGGIIWDFRFSMATPKPA